MKPLKIEYTQIADKQDGLLPYLADCVKMLIRNKDDEGLQQLINDINFVADSLFDLNEQAAAAQIKFEKENARLKEAEEKARAAQEEAERIRKQMTESFGDPEADKEEMSGIADIFGNTLTTDSLLDSITLDAIEDKDRVPTKDEVLRATEGLGISFGSDDEEYSSAPLSLGEALPALGNENILNELGNTENSNEKTEKDEELSFGFTTDDFDFSFDDIDFSVPEANSDSAIEDELLGDSDSDKDIFNENELPSDDSLSKDMFGEDDETFDELFPEEDELDTGGILFDDDQDILDDSSETSKNESADLFASDDDDDFDFSSGSLIDTL